MQNTVFISSKTDKVIVVIWYLIEWSTASPRQFVNMKQLYIDLTNQSSEKGLSEFAKTKMQKSILFHLYPRDLQGDVPTSAKNLMALHLVSYGIKYLNYTILPFTGTWQFLTHKVCFF